MTRSFRIINTSNWSDEPLRYDLGEGIGGELKAGEASCGIALQGANSDVRLTVKGTLSDTKPAPVYNEAGVQLRPRVCVRWLPEGSPSWDETCELLDNARGEIRRLEGVVRQKQEHLDEVIEHNAEHTKALEHMKADILELSEGSLAKQRDSLMDTVAKKEGQIANQKSTIEDLQAVQDDQAEALTRANKLMDEVVKERDALKAGRGGWVPAEVAAEKDKEIAELKAERDGLLEKLKNPNGGWSHAEKDVEIKRLRKAVGDSSEHNELHRQIRELTAEVRTQCEKVVDMQAELDAAVRERDDSKATARLAGCDKANLSKTADDLEAELKLSRAENQRLAERVSKQVDELAELKARRDEDYETSLAEMNAKQCDTIRDLDAEVAELKRRCDEQKETILELLADRRKLDAVRNALR